MGGKYIIGEIEKDHILSLLEQKKRIDGRTFTGFREITIETNVVEKAEGSAIINIGDTKLIVGVKAILGTPYPDSPESGVITTGAELSPIASPYFESGPPSEAAIELARVTDRTIRESHCVDLSKLCVVPEKHVWILFIDFYVLNHDGNLFDAAALGAIAALATTKLPKVKILEDGSVEKSEEKEPLKIDHYPVAITCYKIDKYRVYDPNFKEDRVSDARITIGFDEEDRIVALQKGDQGTYKPAEIMEIVRESLNVSKALRKELMKSLS